MKAEYFRPIYDNNGLWREFAQTNKIVSKPVVVRKLILMTIQVRGSNSTLFTIIGVQKMLR